MSDWVRAQHAALRAAVTDPARAYPCHFAGQAEGKGDNWYAAVTATGHRPDPDGIARLAKELREFVASCARLPRGRRATLLCAAGPPGTTTSLAQDRELFWRILAGLRAVDDTPHPRTVPPDVADPAWTFAFAGERMFAFGLSPFYGRRASRRIGNCLTVCFQSDRVFAGISGSAPSGVSAKATIRARLADYDDVPLIAALGDGLSSTTDKWRQYFPPEDGALETGACPLIAIERHG